jgi:hypothetical protein
MAQFIGFVFPRVALSPDFDRGVFPFPVGLLPNFTGGDYTLLTTGVQAICSFAALVKIRMRFRQPALSANLFWLFHFNPYRAPTSAAPLRHPSAGPRRRDFSHTSFLASLSHSLNHLESSQLFMIPSQFLCWPAPRFPRLTTSWTLGEPAGLLQKICLA